MDENQEIHEKLLTLRPINFKFKNEESKRLRKGVIAQDLQKVFPEMVEKEDDHLGIYENELIPLLLNVSIIMFLHY